ncbi:MAG: transcriptional repressor LexA [Microthrixaceae bacterium]
MSTRKATNQQTEPTGPPLTARQREVLDCVIDSVNTRGYPPSVREIGTAVGLTSPSTVHSHLATLQRLGYLKRDSTKPRAIEIHTDGKADVGERRPVRHVPLVGTVAAGTGVLAHEQVEEVLPLPADLTGDGELFMLTVRGDSMVDAGIFNGDFVVARQQDTAERGDIVVAGIPGEEATVKTLTKHSAKGTTLTPANSAMEPLVFPPGEVIIFGRVVTVLRKL